MVITTQIFNEKLLFCAYGPYYLLLFEAMIKIRISTPFVYSGGGILLRFFLLLNYSILNALFDSLYFGSTGSWFLSDINFPKVYSLVLITHLDNSYCKEYILQVHYIRIIWISNNYYIHHYVYILTKRKEGKKNWVNHEIEYILLYYQAMLISIFTSRDLGERK